MPGLIGLIRKLRDRSKPREKQNLELNLGQVKIDNETIKHDYQVLDKYQSFSTELLRLSLLGIGALPFVLREMLPKAMPHPPDTMYFLTSMSIKVLMSISAIFFALSAAWALAHRYHSTDSIAYHIKYLRLKQWKVENERVEGATVDLEQVNKVIKSEKSERDSLLELSGDLIAASASHLGVGTIFLAVAVLIGLICK